MRTFPDRVRHALLFEALGLIIIVPASAYAFDQSPVHMGVVGVVAATVATVWNFLFNLGFDHAMRVVIGHVRKSIPVRILHAILFEFGLLLLLLPPIAWYLEMTLLQTFLMDLTIVIFYMVYAFGFNLAYDRIFPVSGGAEPPLETCG